ncbi:MAG: carboxylesterase family protein [Blautia sp.]|nr:carboxylesterase family protein [Blautia sp.]
MIATNYGKVEGLDMGEYTVYRGIPYAKPPIGERRWKAPERPERWDGILEAKAFTPRCVQTDYAGDGFDFGKEFYSNPEFKRENSEDCLYLHIWVPNEKGEGKLPVAFWIHGGAFLGGFASELEFDGAAYCKRGVILVSVEYRCNIFGYFAHPWLTEENPEQISGNYGTLDQIAALTWVYENIEAFGGNKDNITIFGQSAGAMSVQTLVSTKLTGNMIAKAIMQSGGSYGGGLHRDIPLAEQEGYGMALPKILGVKSLEELREKTTEEVQEAFGLFMGMNMPKAKGLFLTPTMDGSLLEDGYYDLMDKGEIKDIPYMLGTTKDDILVEPGMVERGEKSVLYKGVLDFSKKLAELGRKPAYAYYFAHDLPGDNCGAWHSCELWYMFGTMERCWRPWKEEDYQLSEEMLDYWVNFMKTGDPNGERLKVWRPCEEEKDLMVF